jgi:hypothetical protein
VPSITKAPDCSGALLFKDTRLQTVARPPAPPRSRWRLPDGEVRACRADTVHPQEGKQIPGRIDHCDGRGRILLLRALSRCLQDHLGSSLIETHHVDGLCPR